jgi:hypothetical protein
MLMTMTTQKAFIVRPCITPEEEALGTHLPLLQQADAATTIIAVEEDQAKAAARERERTLRLPFVLNAAFDCCPWPVAGCIMSKCACAR